MNRTQLTMITAGFLALASAAAGAQDTQAPSRPHDVVVGRAIAELGNRALLTIRTELDANLRRSVELPELVGSADLLQSQAVPQEVQLADAGVDI